MDDASLRADCGRCIGLCCVLLAFDAGNGFAFDKPAHQPCRHLGGDHRCGIHAGLVAKGMSGCAAYDCHGAGQAVTAMFQGHHWSESPTTLRLMAEVFRRVREANRWIAIVRLGLGRDEGSADGA